MKCEGPSNRGIPLDLAWLGSAVVDLPGVKHHAPTLGTRRTVKQQRQAAWLLRAATCIDLTTLAGDDTEANVSRLCLKAAKPVRGDLLTAMGMADAGLRCGAVCVYPTRVWEAR